MSTIFLLLIISFFAPTKSVFSVKQQYFTLVASGKRAKNCVISNATFGTRLFCLKHCLVNSQCFGVNYHSESGLCEFLSEKLDLNFLEDDLDFGLFHKKIDCVNSPCKHGQCINTDLTTTEYRAYSCDCPCGWCGWNCERINYGIKKNKCIELNNAGFKKVKSDKECMLFCAQTPDCRSADFILDKNECWLNAVDDKIESLNDNCTGAWFLAFDCDCSNSK
ncbi:neurogenic locus notch homolog protein 1-like [Centruroides sculpturatus]|uniref:neurogenic locus notch homolog protein 1-like n=1 Tax=Centruroides sculpturatus TaxID=218467 RepID=UPI000C6CC379|nr:neurogenic locus notch homolog protein 1-like [Centruroides sculpturatus]